MFLGQYQHTIDNKGRLTIPARYRELLDTEGAYITRGFDHNLMVLPVPYFNRMSHEANQLSVTDPRARLLKRLLYGNAGMVEIDRAGRILIPQFLREVVGLDGEAIVVGVGDYFEVWSPEMWSGQTLQLQEAETDAQRFMDLDLSAGPE
jgi:MraZ protein